MKSKSSDFSAASGSGYELQMGRFSRLLAPKFLDLIELADSGNILDAGCGTGALTSEILRRTETANITGIDIDLPSKAPSFITRVCGFGFHILWFRFGQARRARRPQIAQALGALLQVFGFLEMSAA